MDALRELLTLLARGHTLEEALYLRPDWPRDDLSRAATQALAALGDAPARVETRAERVARVRRTHPRAFEPWTEDEDARLLRRFDEGARVADLARELGRPPGAVRMRLERWLGPSWRDRGAGPAGGRHGED